MTLIGMIKNILKRILPPPVKSFMREVERILDEVRSQGRKQDLGVKSLENSQELLRTDLQSVQQHLREQLAELQKMTAESAALLCEIKTMQDHIHGVLTDTKIRTAEKLSDLQQRQDEMQRFTASKAEEEQLARQQSEKRVKEELSQLQEIIQVQNNGFASVAQKVESVREALSKEIAHTSQQVEKSKRNASEAVWAEIFNNTIAGSTWLKNTAFSPGRWAVGYPVLYVMYRVLNEVRPKRILELGLGQSTRMIAQYAAANKGVEHVVVEHDPEWISFFENDFQLSERTKIVQLDREMVPYKEAEAVRVFKGFKEMFQGQKFDFIFIDAPLGGDMKQYARIDLLSILPECLNEKFVIMIDDTERSGEANTAREITKYLTECGVAVKKGWYWGKKDMILLCDEQQSFLTSM